MDDADVREITSSNSELINSESIRDTRTNYQKRLAVHLILASTLFERIAFYTISVNLILSVGPNTPFAWSNTNSSIATLMFSGVTCILTLIFAILTDAKSDRFKAITFGLFIYIIGYVVAILGTNSHICNYNKNSYKPTDSRSVFTEKCSPWILSALIVIGIGAGAVQSNMPVFGVEQIEEIPATRKYFDKHVAAVCIAAATSKLLISYIQDKDPTKLFIGYIFAISMLFISIILFIIGYRFYIRNKPYDSVVTNCLPVIKNAFKIWLSYKKNPYIIKRKRNNTYGSVVQNNLDNTIRVKPKEANKRRLEFLDFAKVVNHGKFPDRIVDDVKLLRRLLVVFTLLIPYWFIYDQVYTSFSAQRQHMKIPPNITYKTTIMTLVSFGDAVTIMIGLLIFNTILYKCLEAHNQSLTITTRFVIGMCFAYLSMCTSGIMEEFRQRQCDENTGRSNLLVYYQIPQNIFMGLAKLSLLPASYEFAYLVSPRSGRSFFMGLRYFSIGLLAFVDSLYIHHFPKIDTDVTFICIKDHQWYWSFYTYFFILAGIQLIFVVIFIACQKKYEIMKINPEAIE